MCFVQLIPRMITYYESLKSYCASFNSSPWRSNTTKLILIKFAPRGLPLEGHVPSNPVLQNDNSESAFFGTPCIHVDSCPPISIPAALLNDQAGRIGQLQNCGNRRAVKQLRRLDLFWHSRSKMQIGPLQLTFQDQNLGQVCNRDNSKPKTDAVVQYLLSNQ